MRVLYLIRRQPGGPAEAIMEASARAYSVTVLDLREKPVDYGEAIALVENSDRVVTW